MREVPFLKTLEEHGVPVTDDTRERMDILIGNLRREPGAAERLKEYGKQSGGGMDIPIPVESTKNDFLGPEMRWFVEVMGSPYAQVAVRMLFTVLFFVSYLEKIPVFGGILSAVLDLMTTGGRVLIKSVQKALPPLFGLLPIPFASLFGMMVAGIFGMFLWPIFAVIAFSRQEFATAVESMLRVIPPPMGDGIADAFMDVNRTVGRMNEKRKKITEDIVSGLRSVMDIATSAKDKVSSGANVLATKLPDIAAQRPEFKGGQPLSRKSRKKGKWRTRRQPTK